MGRASLLGIPADSVQVRQRLQEVEPCAGQGEKWLAHTRRDPVDGRKDAELTRGLVFASTSYVSDPEEATYTTTFMVGQGLYSSHLAAVYKHNHSFIDPNFWYNEDELRKHLENFASAFILTAQERPDSNRKFREDLYKKLVSADDLAARIPYGYVTRMLRVIGWKRIETNDLLEFHTVSESRGLRFRA
ncbi:hypothetical protein AK812_SmicGene10076 [Symbiodinium microadriaticum]|uniref:Uncharacterized protein n=1 Tax=Symbiodinium microadriaticum TaxID=2951 RepID=A0A1Q9EGQ0_SYMMI|nr:hypothetical protein AK812_SmicGene10076 [Symbiodinium microadriaticum]